MIRTNIPTVRFPLLFGGKSDKISISVDLTKNPIKDNYRHASIVIGGYCYSVGGIDYTIKLSIIARQCIVDNMFNQTVPPRVIMIHEMRPTKGVGSSSIENRVKAEDELAAQVCSTWQAFLQDRYSIK